LNYIVVDGASTDGTLDVLKQYKHIRWISEPDNGEAEALNKAYRMATGDIVGWLNADDYYFSNDIFHKISKIISTDNNKQVVVGNSLIINQNDEIVGCRVPISPINFCSLTRWFKNIHIYQPSMFFTKEVLTQVGGFREDLYFSIDLDFWLRIAEKSYDFIVIDNVIACSRLIRDDAKSSASRIEQEDSWHKLVLEYINKLPKDYRINYWKEYFIYRNNSNTYRDITLSNIPSEEASIGFSLALLDSGCFVELLPILSRFVTDFPKSKQLLWAVGECAAAIGDKELSETYYRIAAQLENVA